MSPFRIRRHRGMALVIALILLLIVTLLATTGMAMSTTEFVMAGNEQFHRKAIDAASAGVEAVVARLSARPSLALTSSGFTAAGEFIASARYVGDETALAGFTAERFIGLHFDVSSDGASARKATDSQIQGVLVIEAMDGVSSFTRRGGGLADRGGEP